MATITPRMKPWNRKEARRRVAHPLQQLRGYIRFYVAAEGLSLLVLYLAVLFWLGLVFDYGFFKLVGVDWVQELPRFFRSLTLGVLLIGLPAALAVRMLLRESFVRGGTAFLVLAGMILYLAAYLALWLEVGNLLSTGRGGLAVVLALGGVAMALVLLLSVLARIILYRFRDRALALVLERRFPDLLGDRLITAVEMANPRLAQRYGYSQAMIDETIREAADRVARAPVQEVFNWKRLRRYAVAVVVLTLGLYLLTGAGYGVYQAAHRQTPSVRGFVHGFNDVVAIWAERNLLLRDTIWPRRAYLEVLDFPGEELRIGRDAAAPTLRVRAWKWVVADSDPEKAREGWRPLTWADLTPDLLGATAPALPGDWQGEDLSKLTLDDVELRLEKPNVRGNLEGEVLPRLRQLLGRLEELAASYRMSRRLRKLVIPDEVDLVLKGATFRGRQTMEKHDNNDYSVSLSDLKESISFVARGEDYSTPARRITLLPPPALIELLLDEDEPAYLYQRPPRSHRLEELRGQKQKFHGRAASLTGDKSVIDIPAGTDLVLTGRTDKALRPLNGVRFVPQPGVEEVKVPIEQGMGESSPGSTHAFDNHSFRLRFQNVIAPIDLLVEFSDPDGVTGQRHVMIKPVLDQPPEAEVQIEVLRKTGQGYLCTPWAQVPFSGKIRDDHGLTTVEYAYTVAPSEIKQDAQAQAPLAANVVVPPGPAGWTHGLVALALWEQLSKPADEEKIPEAKVPVDTFDQLLRERALEDVPLPQWRDLLVQPVASVQEVNRRLLKEHTLDPERDYFDVAMLKVGTTDPKKIQPHYRLRLRVVATDNDIETGPHQSQRKEKFTVMIVSEEELLAEIAHEEDGLRLKLQEAVDGLKDARNKLDNVTQELDRLKPEEFSPMTRRAEEMDEVIGKGWNIAREVDTDYTRILKELKVNQGKQAPQGLISKMITRVDERICKPLETTIDPEFPKADESMREFQKTLEAKAKDPQAADRAKGDLTRVINRLQGVLDVMAEIEGLNDLIKIIARIRDAEDEQLQLLKKLKEEKAKKILEDAGSPDDPGKP